MTSYDVWENMRSINEQIEKLLSGKAQYNSAKVNALRTNFAELVEKSDHQYSQNCQIKRFGVLMEKRMKMSIKDMD